MTTFNILKTSLAILLFATAGLKALDASRLLHSDGLFAVAGVLPLAIAAEVAVAIFLLLAPPKFAHPVAIVWFTILACVAAGTWWLDADCGCFGAGTPKGLPLLIDLGVLLLLIGLWPRVGQRRVQSRRCPGRTRGRHPVDLNSTWK